MTIHNSQEVSERLSQLPESFQDFLASPACVKALISISKKYNLHVDQTGKLSDQAVYTIIGLEKLSDFKTRITNELGIPEDIANLITYDINQQIFSKIRKELEELSRGIKTPAENSPGEQVGQLPKPNPSAPAMFDVKMTSVTNVPKQEVAVTPQTADNSKVAPTRDPYHEPI
ncbi:MAG: hypothetical protein WC385_02085 [Candidatus Paceibacterota bacterium]|jgi:hypothetical protein